MVCRFHNEEKAMKRKTVEFVHAGKYAAEVPVELIEEEGGWSPYLSLDDAKKLDAVRLALRQGNVAAAAKHGRVFELRPVSAAE
jgi:hypothetical protein